MKSIKVLGSGCAACKALSESLSRKAQEAGLDVTVEKITDFESIAAYGVVSVPAIVIDEKVVHAGGKLSDGQIEMLLVDAQKAEVKDGCASSCGCCCGCGGNDE